MKSTEQIPLEKGLSTSKIAIRHDFKSQAF